jgi:hypothetical protein
MDMHPRDIIVIVLFVILSLFLSPALCPVFMGLAEAFSVGMPEPMKFLVFFLMSTAASGFVLSIALAAVGRKSYSLPGGAIGGLVFSLIELIVCSF